MRNGIVNVAGGDQVGLLDVVEDEIVLPLGIAKTVVATGRSSHRRHGLAHHPLQGVVPQFEIVASHLHLHFGKLPGVCLQIGPQVHKRLANAQLIGCLFRGNAVSSAPVHEILQQLGGTLRYFGKNPGGLFRVLVACGPFRRCIAHDG